MFDSLNGSSLLLSSDGWHRKDYRRLLRDYAEVGIALQWQRQLMMVSIAVLVAFYYDFKVALACLALIEASEALDFVLFRRIVAVPDMTRPLVRRFMRLTVLSTVLSAAAISIFAISIAVQQGQTPHFTPLFVLFAAALFATMHNHQLVPILLLRLAIYSAAFLYIPIRDIVIVQPPLSSELWLQLVVAIMVLFFILESARGHLQLYRESLEHFHDLTVEHARATAALQAKSEFLSVVSHELRTPLTSIKGSLDMIGAGVFGPLPETMARPFDIAQQNSKRLADLINDLLDFQKMDTGKMEYDLVRVEVKDLVGEAVTNIRPMAEAGGIELIQLDETGSYYVNVDRLRIEQVLTNLLSNAIKFSNRGSRVLVTTKHAKDRIRISVSDEGVGLPDNAEDRIFQPFSQLDSSSVRQAGGTGLGLSISKRIVDAHRGLIGFIRHEDKGTTFFVELNLDTSAN